MIFEDAHGYRFYSSSLLLLYEGDSLCLAPSPPIIRFIDFANTRVNNADMLPDEGLLLGCRNLKKILFDALDILLSTLLPPLEDSIAPPPTL